MSGALTLTEQKLLANAWQCIEGQPNIDFARLAEIMGHTNKRTTQNMMGIIRKKLAAADGSILPLASAAPATPTKANSTPKAAGKKRKAAADEEENDDELGGAEAVETPLSKKGKRANGSSPKKPRATKKQNIKKEEEQDDDGNDEEVEAKQESEAEDGASNGESA